MKIIIDKDFILAPVSKLVNITEKRSLMPILSNILIEFSRDKTIVYSTDLEVSAISYLDYKTDTEKKIVIHGRKFLDILKELDSGEISLEIKENTLTIRQKQTEIVLSLQDPEEFPEIKEITGQEEFYLDGRTLLEMINKVGFGVSVDETRYVLTGMHMRGTGGKVIVVGTDGFRMALYQKEIKGLKGFKGITIPKRSITEVERVIDNEDEVKLTIDEKRVQFSTKKVTIISRVIEGNFPDYENVVPVNNNIATIFKEAFIKGLKKVSVIIGRSEPIKIKLIEGAMEIEAESDMGHAREVVEVEYHGEEISMNFNVRFVMDVVTHIDGESVVMKVPLIYGAVVFEGKEGEYYKNIVMPIKV